jgi:hypothetical protein
LQALGLELAAVSPERLEQGVLHSVILAGVGHREPTLSRMPRDVL